MAPAYRGKVVPLSTVDFRDELVATRGYLSGGGINDAVSSHGKDTSTISDAAAAACVADAMMA